MTTVLIDFKNKKIVADKQSTYSKCEDDFWGCKGEDYFHPEVTSKIQKMEGYWFVAAGKVSEIDRQQQLLRGGNMFLSSPRAIVTIALVRAKNKGLIVDVYKAVESKFFKFLSWEKEVVQGDSKVITFGSGGNFAYGAFMGGCSAEESVTAASYCDIYTGLGLDVEEVV